MDKSKLKLEKIDIKSVSKIDESNSIGNRNKTKSKLKFDNKNSNENDSDILDTESISKVSKNNNIKKYNKSKLKEKVNNNFREDRDIVSKSDEDATDDNRFSTETRPKSKEIVQNYHKSKLREELNNQNIDADNNFNGSKNISTQSNFSENAIFDNKNYSDESSYSINKGNIEQNQNNINDNQKISNTEKYHSEINKHSKFREQSFINSNETEEVKPINQTQKYFQNKENIKIKNQGKNIDLDKKSNVSNNSILNSKLKDEKKTKNIDEKFIVENKSFKNNLKTKSTKAKTITYQQMRSTVRKEVDKSNKDENTGVDSILKVEKTTNFTIDSSKKAYKVYKNMGNIKQNRIDKQHSKTNNNFNINKNTIDKSIKEHTAKAQQKKMIKKEYAKQYRKEMQKKANQTAKKGAEKIVKGTSEMAKNIGQAMIKNPKNMFIIGLVIVGSLGFVTILSSVGTLFQGTINAVVGTSYAIEEEKSLEINESYSSLAEQLKEDIRNIETDYPDYNEYIYNTDEFGHNSHDLIAYLSVLVTYNEDFDLDIEMQNLFELQYNFELEERTELRLNDYGEEYEYKILVVNLTNTSIKTIAESVFNDEELELFYMYLESKGNNPDLFEDIYSEFDKGQYDDYDIPPHHLTDSDFSALITEAEKYLGYPYVWGGSNPSTSFDCSGFVSWVLRESGVYNIQRTTAQGLFNQTIPVAPSEAKPGDIIYFTGTYDSVGAVSHVGIYVGDGMMIHCGNPIGYANVSSGYWQEHFYAFGRLPE